MSDYERIWLQTTDEHGEATWCQNKINDDDVEYVRVDLYAALKRENEKWRKLINKHRLGILETDDDTD